MIFHCGFPNHYDLFCQVGLLTGSIFIRDCAVRTSKAIDIDNFMCFILSLLEILLNS